MLVEHKDVRQIENEGFRRWFTDDFFDLIVWYEEDKIIGFQLCYDKSKHERALTWRSGYGFSHNRIDDGELPGHSKMTPILVEDGDFSKETIAAKFRSESRDIDRGIADFIYEKIKH